MEINQPRLIMRNGLLVLGTEIPKDKPSEKWENLSVVLQFEHTGTGLNMGEPMELMV